jgi:hypothetical protein
LASVPIQPNVLWETAEEALAAPRADLALALCQQCGLIWNVAFDPDALSYGAAYENSLHFSSEFQRYSESLADRLATRYVPADGRVVEIGSGKGEFLSALCERAGCAGVGFDPSYAGEADGRADGRVAFVREYFTKNSTVGRADLIVCRHVVEHLADPLAFLETLRGPLQGPGSTGVLYVEVPAAEYLLREDAIWDLIYPHVSLLSASSLRYLIGRAGFDVRAHGFSFGDQYLWVEASPTPVVVKTPSAVNGTVGRLVSRFAERCAAKRIDWGRRLADQLSAGPVALWGAGAKGATFLNIVDGGSAIAAVVDANPRKHGKYVSGTGQIIISPEALSRHDPATVLLMNPIYKNEIDRQLRALRVDADVIVV